MPQRFFLLLYRPKAQAPRAASFRQVRRFPQYPIRPCGRKAPMPLRLFPCRFHNYIQFSVLFRPKGNPLRAALTIMDKTPYSTFLR